MEWSIRVESTFGVAYVFYGVESWSGVVEWSIGVEWSQILEVKEL